MSSFLGSGGGGPAVALAGSAVVTALAGSAVVAVVAALAPVVTVVAALTPVVAVVAAPAVVPAPAPANGQAGVFRRALTIARVQDVAAGYVAEALATDLQVRVKVVRGEMDANSFYSSAVAAGVVDSLVSEFAAAFTFDFDFQREIRPGDIFEAAFEQQVDSRGDVVGAERLVYA